jgi:hypothetical protein
MAEKKLVRNPSSFNLKEFSAEGSFKKSDSPPHSSSNLSNVSKRQTKVKEGELHQGLGNIIASKKYLFPIKKLGRTQIPPL